MKVFNILSTLRHVEKAVEKVAIEKTLHSIGAGFLRCMFSVATVLLQMGDGPENVSLVSQMFNHHV